MTPRVGDGAQLGLQIGVEILQHKVVIRLMPARALQDRVAQFRQRPVLVPEGAVGEGVQRAAQHGVLPVDFSGIVGFPDRVQFLNRRAEDVVVFPSGLLDNLHVRAVEGSKGYGAVQHQLHVAGSGGLRARG